MRREKLGLRLSAAAAFSIPPAGSIRVQGRARSTLDRDACARDLKQRAVPFLIAPSCLAFEDDLSIDI